MTGHRFTLAFCQLLEIESSLDANVLTKTSFLSTLANQSCNYILQTFLLLKSQSGILIEVEVESYPFEQDLLVQR